MRLISRNIRYILRGNCRNRYQSCFFKTLVPENSEKPKNVASKEENDYEEDFFGINEGIKYDNETVAKDEIKSDLTEKYNFNPPKSYSDYDVVYELPFGNVRFDNATVKDTNDSNGAEKNDKSFSHASGSFDISLMKTVVKEKYFEKETALDYVDEQYFGELKENVTINLDSKSGHDSYAREMSADSDYTDEDIFGYKIQREKSKIEANKENEITSSGSDYIDESVFGPDIRKFKTRDYKTTDEDTHPTHEDVSSFDIRKRETMDYKIPRETLKIESNKGKEIPINNSTSNIFDKQYFNFSDSNQSQFVQELKPPELDKDATYATRNPNLEIQNENKPDVKRNDPILRKKTENKEKSTTKDTEDKKFVQSQENISNKKTETAFDYVKTIRAKKLIEKKILENTSNPKNETVPNKDDVEKTARSSAMKAPNYSKLISPEVLMLLKNSIIYNYGDILAINKPYGMICHGKETKNSDVLGLSNFMDDLAKYASQGSDGKLYLTHRLDRDTTGVLLLAKTQKMATILSEMFADHKILKTYYALCKGVPSNPEGIIDIPISEGHVRDIYRMVLNPEIKDDKGSILKIPSSKARRAVTRYKVLQKHSSTSFLEVKPLTGYKHQIRVHLGFGLSCPIIGDHKYSYLSKLAPQKLPGDVLEALNIRQSKVRDLPMYLHASSIVIPEINEGRNVLITAKLPHHFTTALYSLKYRKK